MEFDHYFYRLNQVLLSTCGFWPYQSRKEKIIRRFIFFIIDFSNLPPLLLYFIHNWGDVDALVYSITITTSCLFGIVKFLTVVIQDKKIHNLFVQITHDWKLWHNEPQVVLLQKYATRGRRINYIYAVAVCASASSYTCVGVVPYIYYSFIPNNNRTQESYQVPEKFLTYSEDYFYWIFTFNILSMWVNSNFYIAADSIYLTLVQHACGLFAAVGNRFEKIGKREKSTRTLLYEEICYCILKYNSALKFAAKLNDIYNVSFFFIVGINAAILIFVASQTVINLDKYSDTIKYGNYGMLMLCLFFLVSYPAQKLMDGSGIISQKIYNSGWYQMPAPMRKYLLILLMRSSRECKINAGKVCILSLQTFTTVVRTTVSVCTMILSIR